MLILLLLQFRQNDNSARVYCEPSLHCSVYYSNVVYIPYNVNNVSIGQLFEAITRLVLAAHATCRR